MVKDKKLYDLLGVAPDVDESQLKKAYRKQALKFHPDKPEGDEEKFKEISEAYDILNDKDKRSIYDQYGLEAARSGQPPMPDFGGAGGAGGMPGGMPGGGMPGGYSFGGGGPQTFHFNTGGGGGGAQFSTDDAFNIFNSFMGGAGGGGMGGGGAHPFASFGGGADDFGGFGGMGGGSSRRSRGAKSMRTSPVEPLVIDLPVSLQDLYQGVTKKLKIKRKGPSGAQESNIVEVNIKPGWKAGTKLTYAGRGDIQPDGTAQDVVFVIKEKPDTAFSRDGNDLHTKLRLTFKEAMLGFSRIIDTIDGKRLRVSQARPARPGQQLRFPDRGMPLGSKHPGKFGDLVVDIEVDMPETLTDAQRTAIENNF